MNEEKKQQAIALGRLGWSLRQIQKAIGVRRETISVYLRAAGIAMRAPRGQYIPAKPASREEGVITDPAEAKPASLGEVITDSGGDSATHARSETGISTQPQPFIQRLYSLPGCDRTRVVPRPKRHGDLAGVSGYLRIRLRLPECQAICLQVGGRPVYGAVRRESRPRPAKRLKSITATAPWFAIRRAASIGAHDCSC